MFEIYLKILFLKSLLKSQFTNLCKSPVLKIAVLKFTVKNAIYKPMQFCGCKTWILNLRFLNLLLKFQFTNLCNSAVVRLGHNNRIFMI